MSSYNEVNGDPGGRERPADRTPWPARRSASTATSPRDCDAVYEMQAGHHWQSRRTPRPRSTSTRRTAYANSAGEDLDCNAGYHDSYNYGNTIPTALDPEHQDADRHLQHRRRRHLAGAAVHRPHRDRRVRRRGRRCPWVQRRAPALGGATWVSSNSNNAITETPQRLAQAQQSADQSIVLLKNDTPQAGSRARCCR